MAYDLGDVVPLTFTVIGATESTTAALTLELPDGTSATPAVTGPVAGVFSVDYAPAAEGRYGVRWVSASPAQATSDVFDVRPPAPGYMISLADAKAHLNLTTTVYDEELRGHIEAATSAIEQYLGEVVVRRTVVETLQVRGRTSAVSLGYIPVLSLTSVASLDGATTWDVDDLDVSDAGTLTVQSGAALSGPVVVTYVAGRSSIPANYALAAKMVVETLYRSQRAPAVGPPVSPVSEMALEPDPYGVVMSSKVRELLGVSGPLVA